MRSPVTPAVTGRGFAYAALSDAYAPSGCRDSRLSEGAMCELRCLRAVRGLLCRYADTHSNMYANADEDMRTRENTACGVCETCGVRVLRREGRQEEEEEEEEEEDSWKKEDIT